jgi:hypothetical protein
MRKLIPVNMHTPHRPYVIRRIDVTVRKFFDRLETYPALHPFGENRMVLFDYELFTYLLK